MGARINGVMPTGRCRICGRTRDELAARMRFPRLISAKRMDEMDRPALERLAAAIPGLGEPSLGMMSVNFLRRIIEPNYEITTGRKPRGVDKMSRPKLEILVSQMIGFGKPWDEITDYELLWSLHILLPGNIVEVCEPCYQEIPQG